MREMIHVALIDRHQLFREGVKLILGEREIFHIVADSDHVNILQEETSFIDIDILLIEINLFMKSYKKIIDILKDQDTKVIVLANPEEESFVMDAVKIGVHGFLMKEMDKASFVQAIQKVDDGGIYIHPYATYNLVTEYRKLIEKEKLGKEDPVVERPRHLLTERECSILQLLTDGQTNQQIAETLGISIKTVKNHVSSIFKKMQVSDRTQAVVIAIRNNWVQLYNTKQNK